MRAVSPTADETSRIGGPTLFGPQPADKPLAAFHTHTLKTRKLPPRPPSSAATPRLVIPRPLQRAPAGAAAASRSPDKRGALTALEEGVKVPRLAEDPAKNPLRSPRYAFKTGSPALGSTVTPTVAGEPTRWSSTLHQVSAGLPGKSPFTAYAEELGPLLAPGSAVAGPQFLDSPSDAAFCGSQLPLRPMETPGPSAAARARRRGLPSGGSSGGGGSSGENRGTQRAPSALAAAAAAGAGAGAAAAAILGAGEPAARRRRRRAPVAPTPPPPPTAVAAPSGHGGRGGGGGGGAAHEMEAKRPKGGKAARRLDRTLPPAGARFRAAQAAEAAPRRAPRRSLPGTGAAAAAAALDPNISTDILAGAEAGDGGRRRRRLPGALVSGQAVVDSLFDDAALQR